MHFHFIRSHSGVTFLTSASQAVLVDLGSAAPHPHVYVMYQNI